MPPMQEPKPHILVVEDEPAIRIGLVDVLVFHGYAVTGAADGTEGLRLALRGTHDLVLLDAMLPGVDGFEILRQIRAADREQAVILLTARAADADVIEGLALGADDYVVKPFSVAALVLRVQAVLRRTRAGALRERTLRFAEDVEVDTVALSGWRQGAPLRFTRREMQVLEYLYAHADRPVPREELLARVWGYGRNLGIETRTVDIHIVKLRRKLEADPASPRVLVTVRGAGYRLVPTAQASTGPA